MEPPSITLTPDSASSDVPKKTIKFQCGLLRETETFLGEDVEDLCRDNLMDFVCDMLNNKVSKQSVLECLSCRLSCQLVAFKYYAYIKRCPHGLSRAL